MTHLEEGNVIEMKKSHPCGNAVFRVAYAGVDVRLVCLKCGREVIMMRDKAQKAVKRIVE